MCEAFCPEDALYVSPLKEHDAALDREAILARGLLGSCRPLLRWDQHAPGAINVEPEAASVSRTNIDENGTSTADGYGPLMAQGDDEEDQLVIGGSLAACWAALAASEAGASVTVVEKRWLGTAGIVAAATSARDYLVPGQVEQNAMTLQLRHAEACEFDDLEFVERVYRHSLKSYPQLLSWGFRPGRLGIFRGPDSLVFLRR